MERDGGLPLSESRWMVQTGSKGLQCPMAPELRVRGCGHAPLGLLRVSQRQCEGVVRPCEWCPGPARRNLSGTAEAFNRLSSQRQLWDESRSFLQKTFGALSAQYFIRAFRTTAKSAENLRTSMLERSNFTMSDRRD